MGLVTGLKKQIAECQAQIKEIQSVCTHPSTATNKRATQIPVTVHYEDEIGGQSGVDFRNGFACSCGLCLHEWIEYADGRKYSPFDQENIGRI